MANRLRRTLDLSDFVTVPLATIIVLLAAPAFAAWQVLAFAIGVIAWTLIEYGVHRALHSRRFPRLRALHMRHHQRPSDLSGGTLWSTAIIVLLTIVALAWPVMAPALGGFLAGYLVFILLHHGEHHGWDLSSVGDLAQHHDRHHHARPRGCFGVTTTVWDRLFGTL